MTSRIFIIFTAFMLSAETLLAQRESATKQEVLPGEIALKSIAIHPLWRTEASPANSMEVDVNPVSFYWPSERREFTQSLKKYDFQLSRRPDFSSIEEESLGQNPSFYVTEKTLSLGKWYWRYRKTNGVWQGPYTFIIGNKTRLDKRPSAKAFVEAVKGNHPRVVISKDRLPAIRETCRKNGTIAKFVSKAEQYFDVVLPDKEWGGKFYKNGTRVFLSNKFPEDHVKSKITSGIWNSAISTLCRTYLLTGDNKYAQEALRWGMRVCSFEIIPSLTTYDGNPYPDGFCFAFYLDCMAYLYDSLYDYMDAKQRAFIRENLAKRLQYYYEYYCNRLENRCFDNHSWQISIAAFVRGAIAIKGDLPEADKYLAYIYNAWTALDPEQSHTDGGWFGGGYVSVNIGVWLEVPTYFKMFTGYNYYDTPFYQNHPYYYLYRQAPGSVEDGFSGDGYGGNGKGLGSKVGLWLRVLGKELNHSVAQWLGNSVKSRPNSFNGAGQVEGENDDGVQQVKKPTNLPRSRAFRDIGIVNMHTDLLNPKNDLHVALRSSPYGTFGHNLASHNAINVIYQGDYLFVPFGHRHGGEKNSVACYRHSRGHNTVLLDGKGQPLSPEAYGWIPRHLEGNKIIYACGDASNAYDAAPFDRETGAFTSAGLKVDDHISRGDMERFRRHTLLLGNSLVLVYDELEAKKPVRWDWMLHCRRTLKVHENVLTVENVNAEVTVIGTTPMTVQIKDRPMFMPINVDGRERQKAGTPYPVIGTYAQLSTVHKVEKQRILCLMQVGKINQVIKESDGSYTCGEWKITPIMSVNDVANLKISNRDSTVSFLLKDERTGETVLRELVNGRMLEKRVVDELPYNAKGLNEVYVNNKADYK